MVLRNVSNNALPISDGEVAKPAQKGSGARQYVQSSVAAFHRESALSLNKTPACTSEEITTGEKLGKGGFAIVHECDYEGHAYAVKALKHSIVHADPKVFQVAASDLWKEALLLSSLDHDNIVKIHAQRMSPDDLSHNFIVLDKLDETLPQRLEKTWFPAYKRARPVERKRLLRQRLQVGLDVCKAIRYLHEEKKLVYRDLKADNVGFDAAGNVKLFDFGLAKELKDSDSANGKYKLSGDTGSYAYMAPEVAKGWKYDASVDVYSFGILLWEISALQYAYSDYEDKHDFRHVWSGDMVLSMADWWPVELQWILKKCTSLFSKSRPSWECIIETLEEILEDDEEEEELARGIKSFRFGSRRSQKLEKGCDSAVRGFSTTLTERRQEHQGRQKFLGIF